LFDIFQSITSHAIYQTLIWHHWSYSTNTWCIYCFDYKINANIIM